MSIYKANYVIHKQLLMYIIMLYVIKLQIMHIAVDLCDLKVQLNN